jgi:hypothetical protein
MAAEGVSGDMKAGLAVRRRENLREEGHYTAVSKSRDAVPAFRAAEHGGTIELANRWLALMIGGGNFETGRAALRHSKTAGSEFNEARGWSHRSRHHGRRDGEGACESGFSGRWL